MPGYTYLQSQMMAALGSSNFLIILSITLISLIITIIASWSIFSKAGYSGALSLWFLIPIAVPIVFLVFAFKRWPILRELEMLRHQRMAWEYQQREYAQVQQMFSNPQYSPNQQIQQHSSGLQHPPYSQYPQG